jgi:hypothetical protein
VTQKKILKKVKDNFNDRIEIVEYDSSKDYDKFQEYNVTSIPTIFIKSDNKIQFSQVGLVPFVKICEKIENCRIKNKSFVI